MADLDALLRDTSRTFALAIPQLPEPTQHQVTLAYLLFRIADTFEDGELWPREQRADALRDLCGLLSARSAPDLTERARRWTSRPPLEHEGYVRLLGEAPAVFEALWALPPRSREIIAAHLCRTAEGMAGVVERDGGRVRLTSLDELRTYCYLVAGIVGEMLTELFLLDRENLERIAPFLRARSVAFGEGLQLVNILKDSDDDARDGRSYLPAGARDRVMDLARDDLARAAEYSGALQAAGAERGLVAFTALPVLLAHAALDCLEEEGPGAKVSRNQVAEIFGELHSRLDEDRPALGDAAGYRRFHASSRARSR